MVDFNLSDVAHTMIDISGRIHAYHKLVRGLTISYLEVSGSQNSLLVERRTHDRKLVSSSPGKGGGEFSSPGLTFCADSYAVRVPGSVTAVACKRPQSSCPKCRWQVTTKQVYTLDPAKLEWTDHAVQA